MYLHVVMIAFNKEITPALRLEIEQCFKNTVKDCMNVERFDFVDNCSKTSIYFTHAIVSVFSNENALEIYRTSTAHNEMMKYLSQHIKEINVLDTHLNQENSL